jgi:hypothetical protein
MTKEEAQKRIEILENRLSDKKIRDMFELNKYIKPIYKYKYPIVSNKTGVKNNG